MPDRFETSAASLSGPASHAFSIAPSDSAELVEVTRGIYVGSAGHLSAVLLSGATVTFSNLAGGTVLPVRVRQVRATGTTAASLLGLV